MPTRICAVPEAGGGEPRRFAGPWGPQSTRRARALRGLREGPVGEALEHPPAVCSLPGATPDAGSEPILTLTRAPRACKGGAITGRSALARPSGLGPSRRPCEHPGHGLLRTNELKHREPGGGVSWLPPVRCVRGLWVLH